MLQLCVLLYNLLQLLGASEIADQITLFSCNIKLLMVSEVLVFHLDQFPHYQSGSKSTQWGLVICSG